MSDKPRVTEDDLLGQFGLLRTDPQKFLDLCNEALRQDPDNPRHYFTRHNAYESLGRLDLAIADLDRAMSFGPEPVDYLARGILQLQRNDAHAAIADFDRCEALDPELWGGSFGPLYRAEAHARLGHEAEAPADCARLAENHWTPRLYGAPGGTKAQITAEIRRRAAAARGGTAR